MPENERSFFASSSVARHLARGAFGFGLIGAAIALVSSVGPAALLIAPVGVVALGGCPTCWVVGLVETISAGRLERSCEQGSCTLSAGRPSGAAVRAASPGE
jgi:hypothetical protein